jgi:hypothetical protein
MRPPTATPCRASLPHVGQPSLLSIICLFVEGHHTRQCGLEGCARATGHDKAPPSTAPQNCSNTRSSAARSSGAPWCRHAVKEKTSRHLVALPGRLRARQAVEKMQLIWVRFVNVQLLIVYPSVASTRRLVKIKLRLPSDEGEAGVPQVTASNFASTRPCPPAGRVAPGR